MDQHRYIDTLENYLMPTKHSFFGNEPEWMFQQDNTPCHKAKSVTEWFEQNNIKIFQWPARSPDLNPIENVWTVLDQRISNFSRRREILKESFKSLTVEYCRKLFDSIRRCTLCIKN